MKHWIVADLLCHACGATQRAVLPVESLRTITEWECDACGVLAARQVGVGLEIGATTTLGASLLEDDALDSLAAHARES